MYFSIFHKGASYTDKFPSQQSKQWFDKSPLGKNWKYFNSIKTKLIKGWEKPRDDSEYYLHNLS